MFAYISPLDFDDYAPVARTFREASEAKHTPSREELLSMELSDEDDVIETPAAMTGNDSFQIIELIKEREAAIRDAA